LKKLQTILALSAIAALSACASTTNSGTVYRAGETQNEQSIRMGYVESVREVTIEKGETGVGVVTGAALGGVAAHSGIGGGNGANAAALVGAVVGGIVGQNIEKNIARGKGYEITVKLDNGDLKAVVQDADEAFRVGDRIRLVSNGRKTRVTH
jgi:outer membrane lipoprotein SlyB